MALRILFLTQWFQPEPFFKGLPFARALKERGHDVEVLTGFPNYPGGTIYSGYRVGFYRRELMDGITVHRVPLYPSHDQSALRRILNYVSFSISAFLVGPWLVNKPDVIYVYNLVTLGPAAFLMRRLFGSKVLMDIQDLWPESVANSGMLENKAALSILQKACNAVYERSDLLTVLSPGFRGELIRRGIPSKKIHVVYNWCDEGSIGFTPADGDDIKCLSPDKTFNVLFAGAMGFAQGLETVLDCAALCEETLPTVQFVLIGGGVDRGRLMHRAREMGLNNVLFLPPRPMAEMGDVFKMADVLLVHLKDDPLFRITIPSKTQAYLFTGKPIIMAVQGDAADLVRNAGAGLACRPDDPKDMHNAVRTLFEMNDDQRRRIGAAGHSFYMEKLSFDKGVERFEGIMKRLLK